MGTLITRSASAPLPANQLTSFSEVSAETRAQLHGQVIAAIRDRGITGKPLATLGVSVMLAIAYAADMGGMATLVGTPPNLSYKEQLTLLFPGAPPPSFAAGRMRESTISRISAAGPVSSSAGASSTAPPSRTGMPLMK